MSELLDHIAEMEKDAAPATSSDVTISRGCAEAALNSMLCDMEFDEALLYDELKAALEKNDAKS